MYVVMFDDAFDITVRVNIRPFAFEENDPLYPYPDITDSQDERYHRMDMVTRSHHTDNAKYWPGGEDNITQPPADLNVSQQLPDADNWGWFEFTIGYNRAGLYTIQIVRAEDNNHDTYHVIGTVILNVVDRDTEFTTSTDYHNPPAIAEQS